MAGEHPGHTALHLIPHTQHRLAWPYLAPFVERGARESAGRVKVEEIRDGLERDRMQAWIAYTPGPVVEVVCITQVLQRGAERVLFVRLIAGNGIDRWLHHFDQILEWGRGKGCTKAELNGRLGWKRILSDWRETRVTLERSLDDAGR